MVPDTCTDHHTCHNVLNLGHCVIRQRSDQGVVQVRARRNEGMDNLLARVAVKESPDFVNVSDMVAGRLRERVYVRTMVMCISNTTPKSRKRW